MDRYTKRFPTFHPKMFRSFAYQIEGIHTDMSSHLKNLVKSHTVGHSEMQAFSRMVDFEESCAEEVEVPRCLEILELEAGVEYDY